MTTQEMHENALRNVPYKYGQKVYFIDPLLGVIGGIVKEIYITLLNGEPQFSFKLQTNRHIKEYETIKHDQLHRTSTDFEQVAHIRYQESMAKINANEAILLSKLNLIKDDKRIAKEQLELDLKKHKELIDAYQSRKEKAVPGGLEGNQ